MRWAEMGSRQQTFNIFWILLTVNLFVSGLDTNVGQATTPTVEQEDEAAAFKRFEDRMVSLMKNVRRQVFPFLTRAAYEVALTPACTRSLTKLYNDLLSLKGWALKMIDSSGKVPSGLLKGSMVTLGNYDECLEINVPPGQSRRDLPILGKYCLTFLYVPSTLLVHLRQFSAGKMRNSSTTERFKELFDLLSRYKFDGTVIHFRFGVCIPSTCPEKDLESILKYALSDSGMTAEIRNCDVKDHFHFTAQQIIILCIFALIAGIVVIATTCDCWFSVKDDSNEKHSSHRDKKLVQILLHFSAISSIKKLFSDEFEEETYFSIPCLRGVTVILFCFYMMVNSYAFIDEHAIRSFSSSINYFTILKEPLFAVIANSMVFVDVMFGIAGFLMLHAPANNLGINNVSVKAGIVKYIFRISLPLLASIGVFLLLPVFGDGPAFYEVLGTPLSACRRNWWTNLIYINNFLKLEDQCMLHTWFLGCLTQVLLIGFAFKWIISRWPTFGLASLGVFTAACSISMGIITVHEQLPPMVSMYFIFSLQAVKRVMETMFFLPYAHVGAFAIGMCTSYWLKQKPNFKIKGVRKSVGRITATVLLCCLVFGLYPYHDGTEMSHAALAIFSSFHGIVLGVIISIALVISIRSDSDIVSQAMSSKYFLPLVKLMYYAYLLHWAVIFFHIAISRERQYLSHYEQISRSFGHILASFLLAFVFHVFFNGVFTLDEVILPASKREETSGSTSLWKRIFARKKFQIQACKVYGISGDLPMQSCKPVPE